MKQHAFLLSSLAIALLASMSGTDALAQDNAHRQSPVGIAHTTLNDTYVKITYGRPYVRDREIFGGLVPYGQVWRTGANEATEITVTGDVQVAGQTLQAGTYSVFTTPNEDNWTVHFNSAVGQWGAYEYDAGLDVLVIEAETETLDEVVDPFTISFEEADGGARLLMQWNRTAIALPISES